MIEVALLEPGVAAEVRTRPVVRVFEVVTAFPARQVCEHSACLDLASRYPNVYLEPSALGSRSSDPTGTNLKAAMKRIRDAGLVDRVLYGSDGPQSPGFVDEYLRSTVTAMREAGYSRDEMRAVLAGNFVRVFAVPEPTQ